MGDNKWAFFRRLWTWVWYKPKLDVVAKKRMDQIDVNKFYLENYGTLNVDM